MPGSPLPDISIDLETRSAPWPYDPEGPVGGKFGTITVTPAPKSVLDASVQSNTLKGDYGYLKFTNQTAADTYTNVEIPSMPGERGFAITFNGKASAYGYAAGIDIDYEYNVPSGHTFFYLKIVQPSNLWLRRMVSFELGNISEVSGWEVGDSVSTSEGMSGVVYEFTTSDGGAPCVVIDEYLGGSPELRLASGKTINNDTKSLSVTSAGVDLIGANAKFLTDWVGLGGVGKEYPYGGMHLGFDMPSISGTDLSESAITFFNASVSTTSGGDARGSQANQLGGGQPYLWDTADNGSVVEMVIERKRSSADGVQDGVFRLWKKVARTGSPFESWGLAFENTSQDIWSPYEDNKFTYGYLFGNKNGAYEQDTTYYLMRLEYWEQKPTFLTDAGV